MKKKTYISLFSCAGVGCYGFKMNDFECIATNELLAPRMEVQKANHKCKYESGYICGDACSKETHDRIYKEIDMWKEKEGLKQVDVVFATPPCQGMSTANYKKNDHEQIRNSLVVQAIKLIKGIHPKVFVFENVRAFMKSICTDISGEDMTIKESIFKNLASDYNIYWKVINFKDYGVPSSRPRTIVIGTSKQVAHLSPLLLFPTRQKEILLKDSIGDLPRLKYCEKDSKDPFHFARPFPKYMLEWIKDLKEGETAFDNPDDKKPCTFDKDGNRIINKGAYMGNKYRRLIWNRPGACIATRSDVMSSQDTIHPEDNRVLSIRELMTLMTIPSTFKWTDHDDQLTVENSDEYLKENEGNIRRCIGEAVPTHIEFDIAGKIKKILEYEDFIDSGENVSGNYYIETQDIWNAQTFNEAYNSIMSIELGKKETFNASISSLKKAIVYVPQLAAYCSNLKHLNILLVGLSQEEKKRIEKLFKQMPLGCNTSIKYAAKQPSSKAFDFIINGENCRVKGPNKNAGKKPKYIESSIF